MKDLSIQASPKNNTPTIEFKISGELSIYGRSIPENAIGFYNPVIDWIKNLEEPYPPKITLTISLEYFNTSTSKILLNIIKLFERVQECSTSSVVIIWQYNKEDSDMYEAGHCFQSVTKVPFEMVPLDVDAQGGALS